MANKLSYIVADHNQYPRKKKKQKNQKKTGLLKK